MTQKELINRTLDKIEREWYVLEEKESEEGHGEVEFERQLEEVKKALEFVYSEGKSDEKAQSKNRIEELQEGMKQQQIQITEFRELAGKYLIQRENAKQEERTRILAILRPLRIEKYIDIKELEAKISDNSQSNNLIRKRLESAPQGEIREGSLHPVSDTLRGCGKDLDGCFPMKCGQSWNCIEPKTLCEECKAKISQEKGENVI